MELKASKLLEKSENHIGLGSEGNGGLTVNRQQTTDNGPESLNKGFLSPGPLSIAKGRPGLASLIQKPESEIQAYVIDGPSLRYLMNRAY